MWPSVERRHLRHTTFAKWGPRKSGFSGIAGFIPLPHVGEIAQGSLPSMQI